MKAAIKILQTNRQALIETIKDQTRNAEYYAKEVISYKSEAANKLKSAENQEKQVQNCCLVRNDAQAHLNQIDAAIALLEKE